MKYGPTGSSRISSPLPSKSHLLCSSRHRLFNNTRVYTYERMYAHVRFSISMICVCIRAGVVVGVGVGVGVDVAVGGYECMCEHKRVDAEDESD